MVALYVADFYNAIIGHYEVSLDHPKRDKQRGRIWRITYKGKKNDKVDLTKLSTEERTEELIKKFDADNLLTRMLALDQISDRVGAEAISALKKSTNNIHAIWALHRLNALDDETIKTLMSGDSLVKIHTLRVLVEKDPNPAYSEIITTALNDKKSTRTTCSNRAPPKISEHSITRSSAGCSS
ncbi:MAG: hypothetical protein WDO15_08930 [Bacteroidota bacterium]